MENDPPIFCVFCGDSDACYQPQGGLEKWYRATKPHERHLPDHYRMVIEMIDTLSGMFEDEQYGDTPSEDRPFVARSRLDENKKKLDAEGWKVLCDHCAKWGPPRRSRCAG
jgi:hypothetical protein